MADRASDAEKPGPTGCSAPVPRIGTLTLIGPPIWISPLASERQVPAFHIEAWFRVTPPSRRMPPGQQSGHPPGLSRINEIPRFRHRLALSTRHQRFAYARLPEPYLTGSGPAFSATLTTTALYRRSLR